MSKLKSGRERLGDDDRVYLPNFGHDEDQHYNTFAFRHTIQAAIRDSKGGLHLMNTRNRPHHTLASARVRCHLRRGSRSLPRRAIDEPSSGAHRSPWPSYSHYDRDTCTQSLPCCSAAPRVHFTRGSRASPATRHWVRTRYPALKPGIPTEILLLPDSAASIRCPGRN